MWQAVLVLLLLMLSLFAPPASAWIHGVAGGGGGGGSCPALGPTLAGLACDSNSWTQFAVGSAAAPGTFGEGTGYSGTGTRIIYVDQINGNNTNDGSFATPVQDPWQGMKDVRSGSPDWVLLRCGQTWTDSALGELGTTGLAEGGPDSSHPMLVSSYDHGATHNPPVPNPASCSARPIMQTSSTWSTTAPYGPEVLLIKGAAGAGNNMAFVGLTFYCFTRDPLNGSYSAPPGDASANIPGVSTGNATANILFEDVGVSFYDGGMQIGFAGNYTKINSMYLRRSEVVSNYPDSGGRNQGIFSFNIGNGPAGYSYYENVIDKNSWNTDDSIALPPNGFSHNLYMDQNTINGDTNTTGTPPQVVGNILTRDGGATLFEVGGLNENNLYALNPDPLAFAVQVNAFAHVISGNVVINPDNLGATGGAASSIAITGRSFLGYPSFPAGSSLSITGNYIVNAATDPAADGVDVLAGAQATVSGNVVYNWGRTASAGITTTNGSLLTQHVSTPGSSYTDNSVSITSAASSNSAGNVDGQNYIVATLSSVSGIQTTAGLVMYKVGSGAAQGPFVAAVIGSTVEIFGTNFSAATPAANGGATFTGTLYFPYYTQALTNVSSTCAGSPSLDIISVGGQIAAVSTAGSDGPTEKKTVAGNSCTAGDTLSASIPGGSGFVVTLDTVTSNTTQSLACNPATNNVVDLTGANTCSFTDPNRTLGSYYAQLSGATANATFTGIIDLNGTLTTTSVTGTINLGDAVTFSGQTKADFIKGNSTTSNSLCTITCTGTGSNNGGTYALTGINKSIGSGAMSSYTAQQFVNLVRAQTKATWNTNYTACAVNKYIKAGFGVTDTCNVNQ